MERKARAIPVKPGKTEALRRYVAELMGPRAEEESAFHRRHGILHETAWLTSMPDGDLVILYQEVEDADRAAGAIREIMTSDAEFPSWVRANLNEIYGLGEDGGGPPPAPELIMDANHRHP